MMQRNQCIFLLIDFLLLTILQNARKHWHCIRDELIGKFAFFDKEEAEQELKRIKGE